MLVAALVTALLPALLVGSHCCLLHRTVPMQVFGPQFCIAGFPPWLLRCAELFHLGSVHTCRNQDLEDMLQQFHHTPQRLGA